MSKGQRLARLQKNLQTNRPLESIEKELAQAAFYIERETGHYVDGEYPTAKFYAVVDEMNEHYKKEEEAYKSKKGKTLK